MTPTKQESPNAVNLKENEMLLLRSDQGAALIDFTNFGDEDGVSTFRWRFLSASSGKEESGKGEVFEKYERKPFGPCCNELKDIGSQLIINAGAFRIKWSYSSLSACWLYVDKTKTQVTVFPDRQFDFFKLSK